MISIDTKVPVFTIGEAVIKKIEVKSLGFVAYCDIGERAAKGKTEAKQITNAIFRERIKSQVTAITSDDKRMQLDDIAVFGIPLRHALAIKEAINNSDNNPAGAVCKMLHKGDGMLTPIHISLGVPIKTGSEDKVISELEFTARNLGDLEDFVSADTELEQATALLRVAVPVGPGITLSSLPSWAADQISLEDGVWIMKNVVPTFLPPPEPSSETP